MKSKKLLLDVSCANKYFDEAPDHFVAELNENVINRIKELAKKVAELDVYCIEFFDCTGTYCSTTTVDDLLTENEIEAEALTEAMLDGVKGSTSRMECNTIKVYEDAFKFTAVPKHCSDSEACGTDRVDLKELDNGNTLKAMNL